MTSLEMKQEFLVGYDKVANLASPGYEDLEISYFLTKAQENFVLSYINPDNKYNESFEETEKVKKYFSRIIKPGTCVISSNQDNKINQHSVFYELPSDCWLVIAEWLETNDTCNSIKTVVPMSHNEYFTVLSDPFKRANSRKAIRLDFNSNNGNNRHEIIYSFGVPTYTINSYKIRYIKNLTPIDVSTNNPVNSELHVSTHRRIVDLAIELALETSEERRLQSFKEINNK